MNEANAKAMNADMRQAVDAIRYAALCKLAGGFRHALMGELQGIQFSAELATRLLQKGADPARIGEYVADIPGQCAKARATSGSLLEWLRPEQNLATTVADGVKACIKLVGDDWLMRGIEVATDLSLPNARVAKALFQELVIVALLTLMDQHTEPIDVDIAAQAQDGWVELRLRARTADREPPLPVAIVQRAFGWEDIELIASAQGVACSCEGETVALRFAVIDV